MQIRCEKCSEWFKAAKYLPVYFRCPCGHDNTEMIRTAFGGMGVIMDKSLTEESPE